MSRNFSKFFYITIKLAFCVVLMKTIIPNPIILTYTVRISTVVLKHRTVKTKTFLNFINTSMVLRAQFNSARVNLLIPLAITTVHANIMRYNSPSGIVYAVNISYIPLIGNFLSSNWKLLQFDWKSWQYISMLLTVTL